MKVKINLSTQTPQPVIPRHWENPCPICGQHPRFSKSDCGENRYHLGCTCGLRTTCVEGLNTNAIAQLVKEWNDLVIDEVFSPAMMKKHNFNTLDVFIVNASSSNIVANYDCEEMDKVFKFIEEKCSKNPYEDYDVCQLVPTPEGHRLQHLATSRILLYAMKSPVFDIENIREDHK